MLSHLYKIEDNYDTTRVEPDETRIVIHIKDKTKTELMTVTTADILVSVHTEHF